MKNTKTTAKKLPAKKTPVNKPRAKRPADEYEMDCVRCGKPFWTSVELQNSFNNVMDDYGLCDECAEYAETNYMSEQYETVYEPICYRERNDYDGN